MNFFYCCCSCFPELMVNCVRMSSNCNSYISFLEAWYRKKGKLKHEPTEPPIKKGRIPHWGTYDQKLWAFLKNIKIIKEAPVCHRYKQYQIKNVGPALSIVEREVKYSTARYLNETIENSQQIKERTERASKRSKKSATVKEKTLENIDEMDSSLPSLTDMSEFNPDSMNNYLDCKVVLNRGEISQEVSDNEPIFKVSTTFENEIHKEFLPLVKQNLEKSSKQIINCMSEKVYTVFGAKAQSSEKSL